MAASEAAAFSARSPAHPILEHLILPCLDNAQLKFPPQDDKPIFIYDLTL
jgi:hypothetical protein